MTNYGQHWRSSKKLKADFEEYFRDNAAETCMNDEAFAFAHHLNTHLKFLLIFSLNDPPLNIRLRRHSLLLLASIAKPVNGQFEGLPQRGARSPLTRRERPLFPAATRRRRRQFRRHSALDSFESGIRGGSEKCAKSDRLLMRTNERLAHAPHLDLHLDRSSLFPLSTSGAREAEFIDAADAERAAADSARADDRVGLFEPLEEERLQLAPEERARSVDRLARPRLTCF